MDTPFTLVVQKVAHGNSELDASESYRIRVTLNSTISQLEELIILRSDEKEDSGIPCFRPVFKFNNKPLEGNCTLAGVLDRDSAQGELSVAELRLVFEYGETLGTKIPVPEFFVINVVSADDAASLLLSCRETLFSTVRDVKEQLLAKFRISGESSALSYKGLDLDDNMSLLDVVGLDVPPPFVVTMSFERFPQFRTPVTNYSNNAVPKPLLRDEFASQLTEIYKISANGATVEISSADCIFNPEGYILLNSYAQAKVKQELNISLRQEIPRQFIASQSQPQAQASSPTPTPTEPLPTVQATAANGGQPEPPVEIHINAAPPEVEAPANVRPAAANNTVFQLFLRELSNNVEEVAQIVVRIALVCALIGPQRAFFILQPPLIYLFMVFSLGAWLFFYGSDISDWIEGRLLDNVPHDRIDYTICKLLAQIFKLAYGVNMSVSEALSRTQEYLFMKVHYDKTDIARAHGIPQTIKRYTLTIVEYVLVLDLSVFPFLATDIQSMRERILIEEQNKMKQAIKEIAEKYSGDPEIQRRLLSHLFEPLEMLLAPNLPPILYQDLIRCYYTSLAIERGH